MESLTIRNIAARPVLLKLKRPVVVRIATMTDWPLILIDLHTEEGVAGLGESDPTPTICHTWQFAAHPGCSRNRARVERGCGCRASRSMSG
ncbi:MAG: hypothetical protein IT530_11500 [Burkholderiales bacterium]|nr:hypothetical protein [Burkholderiales bacterium]